MINHNVVIAATDGASDIALVNGWLKIEGAPDIKFLNDLSVGEGWLGSLVEVLSESTVTLTTGATATPNTEYSFSVTIHDEGGGRKRTIPISYKSDATGTSTDIVAGLAAQITSLNAKGYKVALGATTSSTLKVLGVAGYGAVMAHAGKTTTVSNAYATVALHATAATAVAAQVAAPHATAGTALAHSSGVITVTTAAAHGLVAGQTVNITGATGFTFTQGGKSSVGEIAGAVIDTVPSTVTFTLKDVVGVGTNTGTIVIATGKIVLTTAAAHTILAGQQVNIAAATGATFWRNGASSVAGIKNARVESVTSTTLVLDPAVTFTGTPTGTSATIQLVATPARGTGAYLRTFLVDDADIDSGATYSVVHFRFFEEVNPENLRKQDQLNTMNLWVKEGITNFEAYRSRLLQVLSAQFPVVEQLAVTG